MMLMTIAVVAVALAGGELDKAFLDPPRAAKPHTWYHMMNGNVTQAGITKDFEALAEVGVGGVQMFDAGCAIPSGKVDFNSPAWYDLFLHAAKEARRLGLEICIPNCSGWSSSGGPWIPPEKSMKVLTVSSTAAKGPAHFSKALPRDRDDHGFYADIAVLAYPTPKAATADFSAVKTTIDRNVVTCTADKPFTADGMAFEFTFDWLWSWYTVATLAVSDDGKAYRDVESFNLTLACSGGQSRGLRHQTFAKSVTTRFMRVTFTRLPPGKGFRVKSLAPERGIHLSELPAKTFAVRAETTRDQSVATKEEVVAKDSVVDLTARLKGDVLDWDVPAGDWTILRVGHKSNGRGNHPASKCGGGLEVDKLSKASIDFHIDQYVTRLVDHLGPLAGRVESGFNNILVDSYEVGSQNWTQGFETFFASRRGYSLIPYLPVFAGAIVGSVDETERFLEDFRRVVADLFAESYSKGLADKCHSLGLMLSNEAYGSCPADNLQYGEYADIPMGEFWSGVGGGDFCTVEGNARYASYIAHVWGKPFAATESFTASPTKAGTGRWRTTPFGIKAQGDRVWCRGVNRFIFHRFTHQPWTKRAYLPGMTMGRWGMHFDRTQTWWPFAGAWIRYLTRCQAMLQTGRFAADVLFFAGEAAPNQGGNSDGNMRKPYELPFGYAWDYCPTDALMDLRVEDGKVVVPGGVKYALLALPDADTMSERVLLHVSDLIDAGAKVCASVRPVRAPGLVGYPAADAKIDELSARVWAKGVMTCSPDEALRRLGIAPDFAATGVPLDGATGVAFTHRTDDAGADWYFVALPNKTPVSFEASFRTTGRVPEIWDPENVTRRRAALWHEKDGRTFVTLDFPVSGSAFVVFREKADAASASLAVVEATAEPLKGLTDEQLAAVQVELAQYGTFETDGSPSARWVAGKVKDVTDRFRAALKKGAQIVASNSLAGGDPVPNEYKRLLVRGMVRGQRFEIMTNEGQPVKLPSLLMQTDPLVPWSIARENGKPVLSAFRPARVTVRDGAGATRTLEVASVPEPVEVTGAWQVSFPHGFLPNALAKGADEVVTFPSLVDWRDHALDGVKYFSGTAVYAKKIDVSALKAAAAKGRVLLDLGTVEELCEVTVNGRTYPTCWKPPFAVDVTDFVASGALDVRVKVANLWANRLIGDDRQHAPDCEWQTVKRGADCEYPISELPDWVLRGRPSPTGRITFTTFRHWDKSDDLQPSGILGPVMLRVVARGE